jgi:hypothetical protein
MTAVMGRSSDVAHFTTDVASNAGVLAAPFQPLAVPVESLPTTLQAVALALQALALSLPHSPAALQPLAVTLPAPLMLHPISLPLQALAAMLEPPASVPGMSTVPGVPAVRVPLGTLEGKGVGRADLGGQRRHRETQRGGEGERRAEMYHAFLPRQGRAARSGRGAGSNGRETTKRSGR